LPHEPAPQDPPAGPLPDLEPLVRDACRQLGMTAGAFDDCLQEARLLAHERRDRLAALPEPDRVPYFRTCLLHHLRRRRQDEQRQRAAEVSLEDLPWEERPAVETPAPAPGRTLAELVSDPAVAETLETLPERERELLELVVLYELTDREIGDKLGLPEGTVKKRRQRLCRRLRRILSPGSGSAGGGRRRVSPPVAQIFCKIVPRPVPFCRRLMLRVY
jgi:RNA polymerase sigma factor (sigma-70 family)